jgi:hypothetical protein
MLSMHGDLKIMVILDVYDLRLSVAKNEWGKNRHWKEIRRVQEKVSKVTRL